METTNKINPIKPINPSAINAIKITPKERKEKPNGDALPPPVTA
jgi:hypothetical protein